MFEAFSRSATPFLALVQSSFDAVRGRHNKFVPRDAEKELGPPSVEDGNIRLLRARLSNRNTE